LHHFRRSLPGDPPLTTLALGLAVNTTNGGLYGLTSFNHGPAQFGSIDPVSGAFTQIGNASLPFGYYAPVYDPAQNLFDFITQPIGDFAFTTAIDQIDPITGAITLFTLPSIPVGGGDPPLTTLALGLAVGSPTAASVPEPSSLLLLLTFLFLIRWHCKRPRALVASRCGRVPEALVRR
jgi:hypothetical protein